jgi:hypothetical protein
VYDLFKDELTQYDVSIIVTGSLADARACRQALLQHADFDKLVARYSLDARSKSRGGALGYYTLTMVGRVLGPQSKMLVSNATPNTICEPLPLGRRVLLIKVGTVKSTFADLQDSIDDVLVNAARAALLHRLEQDAKIESRYFTPPAPAGSPSGAASSVTEMSPDLPSLDESASPAPLDSSSPGP